MSEEDSSSASGNACSTSPSVQQQLNSEVWRGLTSGGAGGVGSRSGGGPRSLLLKRSENGFGFTLRHFIVYPPESYTVLVPGCRSGCEPMDTMFVKSVRPNSPAACAGLQTGDRVVSVNGQTVTGSLTYAHVVHMISQSPKHLHLLVVPRHDDLLQLYFGDTAHNPETNPRVRLRSPSSGGSASPSRRPPLLSHHQSVPPLTPPLLSHHHHHSSRLLAVNPGGGRECSSLSLEAGVGGGGGNQEWRRASDGGGGGEKDGDSCSASSSLDSMSRADFHSSDDSLIIDRIRKSFEQKEEFLRGGVTQPSASPSNPPIQWPAAIPASCVIKPSTTEQVPWRTKPAAVSPRCKGLTRIDESGSSSMSMSSCSSSALGGALVPVATRAQVFEEGAGLTGVQLFRSELAGLSEKRSAPDVALRRRQFETQGITSRTQDGGGPVPSAANQDKRAGISRSLDMGCAMSGNRTTPVGGSRLHCEPPVQRQSPTSNQGLATSNSSSSIGSEWGGGGTSSSPPPVSQRHKAVRQDSYLAACHKPQTTQAASSEVAADSAAAVTADSENEKQQLEKKKQKKKKLKSSSLRSAVRPSRLDLAKVARPLSCGGTPPPSPLSQDAKDDLIKQSPTDDQQNTDVDQSHQKRVSYLKQIWTENANRTSPTPPSSSQLLNERLKKKKKREDGEAAAEQDEGPLVVVEGSLMCSVLDTASSGTANRRVALSSSQQWNPVWAILRGPVLHLMRLKQAETPGLSSPLGTDQLACREEWWSQDLCARGVIIQQCVVDPSSTAPATATKRGANTRHVISVQVPPQSADHQPQPADQLLLQAADVCSHEQWLRALHNVVDKPAPRGEGRKNSEDCQPAGQSSQTPQVQVQQQQQQLASPKCKTWKGRVAKQFRRIGQAGSGGGGTREGGSSPISPTAGPPQASASYQEGASIGVPLDWCPQSANHDGVPLLVDVCCGEVEGRGLEVVGVYRVPGNTAAVTNLTEQVNKASGGDVIAGLVAQADVNVVSSLLKSLFRRLPDALLTSDLYPLFIAADKIPDPLLRAATIRKLVHSLPDHHFETLRFVMAHLKRVVARSEVNKMEARNLAIVFGPTLVRTSDDDSMLTLVTDMSHQCRIVETLILHADWCFSDDDIDRLQLASGGGGGSVSGDGPSLPPGPTVDHITDNHSLLLENIHKVQGMKSGIGEVGGGGGSNMKEISAKDIVVSIIGAANRKMHKSKSRSGCGTSSSKLQQQTSEVDGGGGSRGVAASIRESVLFSGSILAASSTASVKHQRKHDGVEERRGSGGSGQEQSGGGDGGSSNAAVDADGMIRTYTGLSACKQERIRRFEQETKAMLQRVGATAVEDRPKREFDFSANQDESPPSGEDLLSSLTSTFDAKMRSLLSGSAAAVTAEVEPPVAGDPADDVTADVTSSTSADVTSPAFRDPSLHRSTSTTSAGSSQHCYQLNRSNSSTGGGGSSQESKQQSVNEEGDEGDEQSSLSLEGKKKKKRVEGEAEEEGEGEEKKDDSVLTKDPLSCKVILQEQKKDDDEAAFVCKVRRSESLEKRALKNADDLLAAGESKISRRSSDRALKRSDSLTKSEKTESNLYRRRQASQQQASKRKNGVGATSSSAGGGGGGGTNTRKCAIKRRHTVGGTKDLTWALDAVETGRSDSGSGAGGSEATYQHRRTSSPDLSRAARSACCTLVVAPWGGEGVGVTSPLESHV
ncbi:rho GTPase-activating protein 21-B isoform X3 [Nilaparvata lugens]|uniref:rho GTPase-activating protein 21-B isoform X3 n=1 Tax=Nilaparvata lugens TaxID=108931 RepID=UPI00193D3D10|nr:rho GTPase-activating protein 21-B isoform X3 [Nilaparvata lugens]